MRSITRPLLARLLVSGLLVGTAVAACKPAAPVAETKPRRKSNEEAQAWQPSTASNVSSSGNATVDAQAKGVQDSWEQARNAKDDAERQRLANEALRRQREMAEPSSSPQ